MKIRSLPLWTLFTFFVLCVARVQAAVTVTPASGGASLSADKAADALVAGWTTLGPITITEPASGTNNFSTGTNLTLILKCPAGYEFNTSVTPGISFTAARDLTTAAIAVNDPNTITITFTVGSTTKLDTLTIGGTNGIQARPTSSTPLAATAHIYRPSTGGGSAAINGITAEANGTGAGTSFGLLTEVGGTITQLAFTTQPGGATAGAAFTTQPVVKTRDQFGNNSTNGLTATLNVVLTRSAGTGLLQGTLTNNIGTAGGNGTASFAGLRIDVAGTDKQLTASAPGLTNALSSIFIVNPAVANRLVIQTQPSATAAAGTAFAQQPVIRIEDSFGNLRTADSSTITAIRSTGTGTLQGTTTINAVGGVGTFTNLSHSVVSTISILFTNGSLTSVTSTPIDVNAGTYSQLQILLPGETNAPGTATGKIGTPTAQGITNSFTIRVRAVDANWNPISSITNTIAISSSDPNAVLPPNAALINGTNSFVVSYKTSGNQTVTATDLATGKTGTSAVVKVNPGRFVKLQLLMPGEMAAPASVSGKTGTPTARTAGSPFDIAVNAVDTNWNLVPGANGTNYTIHITSSDANATIPANANLTNGTHTFSVTFKTAGSKTVTASDVDDATKTTSTSPATTVNVGAFAKLQLLLPGETAAPGTATGKTGTPTAQNTDNSFIATVKAVDVNWNPVTNATDVVGITSSDVNAIPPNSAALSGGIQTFSFNFNTAGTRTLTASDLTDASKTTNTSSSVNVTSGALAKLLLLMPGEMAAPGTIVGKTGSPTAQSAGTAVSVTVNAVDANWNLVNTNDTVHITSSDANAVVPTNAPLASGTKNFSLTFKTGGSQTASASDVTHSGILTNTGSATIIKAGTFTKLQILVPGETAAPGTAPGKINSPLGQGTNSPFNVTVNAVDANWNLINTNDTIRITSSETNSILPANATLVAGTRNFSITFKTLGNKTVVASDVTHSGIATNTSSSITMGSKGSQTITFAPLANKVYGDAPFTVAAEASSGLPVSFAILSGPATISNNIVTVTSAGSVAIRATQAGNASYSAAPSVDQSFVVAAANLSITASDASRNFGETNPPFTGTITGVKNGDNITGSYSTSADINSAIGVYTITPTPVDPNGRLSNYIVATTNGLLSVNTAIILWSAAEGGNDHAYEADIAPRGITWGDAQAIAVAKGGYLAAITSSNENQFAFNLVRSNNAFWVFEFGEALGPWLGGLQPPGSAEPAGGWSWVTGEPFIYNNWGPNQPNEDEPGDQNRIQFFSLTPNIDVANEWNDLHDTDAPLVSSFIIEYDTFPGGSSEKTNQTITFAALTNKTYGDAPFTVSATASSGLPVTFSILSGPATISNDLVTITAAGTVTVRASQSGNSNYNAAVHVDRAFTVVANGVVQWPASIGGNSHFYEAILMTNGITWNDAQTNAAARGGYLTTITSSSENDFVFGLISGNASFWVEDGAGGDGPWIGGLQPVGSGEPAGGWSWVTGEPFTYNNWASGQPNDSQINQDRIQFFSPSSLIGKFWNDAGNSQSDYAHGYVVEYNTNPAGEITPPAIEQVDTRDPANIVITWSAVNGATYRVQYKLDINGAAWTDLAPDVTASNSTASFTDHPGAAVRRFYRIGRLP
ncbi:MAG: hypothetical protein JWQ71_4621 [Pedosphaera sp.]|nr:hypothetical protein [Pedosphaera sp.]